MTGKDSKVFQLKATLAAVRPAVWRRILVRDDMTLADLHDILQLAMGWTNSHLHQFIKGQTYYGIPDEMEDMETIDESTVRLATVFRAPKSSIIYEYDFGDGWEHKIVLEKILPAATDGTIPRCLAGSGACPLEDSGGPYGYANLLKALKNPKDPEHDNAMEFAPEDFDPAAFDLAEVNEDLASLARGERPERLAFFEDGPDDENDDLDDDDWDDDDLDDDAEGIAGPGITNYLMDALLLAVNNQLRINDPPAVRAALSRLRKEGISETMAKKMIAATLFIEMANVVQNKVAPNMKRYSDNLARLPEEPTV